MPCPHFQSTASLPELLDFGYNENERIVISRVGISVRSVFGPLIGHHDGISSSQKDPTGSVLKCQPEVHDNISNWMKFIRQAPTCDEQNLSVFRYEGAVYLVVIREISVGEELRVGMPENDPSHSASDNNALLEPMGESWALEVEIDDAVKIPLPVRLDSGRNRKVRKAEISFEGVPDRRRSSRVATSTKKREERETESGSEIRKGLPEVGCDLLERLDVAGTSSSFQRSKSKLPKLSRKSRKTKISTKSTKTTAPENNLKQYRSHDCPCCDAKFLIRAEFEEHILTHSVDGKFPCRVCGKLLSSIPSLRRHMSTEHGGQKVYCDKCQWVGKAKISLQDHLRTKHGKIVLRKCPHCEKMFERPDRMRLHIARFHDREIPWRPKRIIDTSYEASFYKCRVCKLALVRRNDLIDHLNAHHPDTGHHTIPELCLPYKKITRYSCGSCVRTAFSEDIIRKHYDEKHKDDADFKMTTFIISGYVCEICEMPFAGGKCFMSHVRSCHPEYVKVLRMDSLE